MSSPIRNPRIQLMLVIGLVTASSFWVWYFAKYQVQIERIEVLVEHENRLRASNQQARRTVAALGLDRIREAIDAYDRQAEHVYVLVPSESDVFDVLPVVTRIAQGTNVRVGGVTPQGEAAAGSFQVRRYQVRVTGRYHDVGAFLTELLSLPRITQVGEVQVRKVADAAAEPGAPPTHLVEATFVLRTYSTPGGAEEVAR